MCVQAVSGDQLVSLRDAAGASVSVFVHRYPRVPKLRVESASELEDPTEYLVTLVSSPARLLASATFDIDPGKGWLAVELEGGLAVINTHVSSGKRGRAQLPLVAATARGLASAVAVAGDFNADVELVRTGLGEGFVLTDLAGQRPTRLTTTDRPARTIDHVTALRCTLASATVLDGGGLSDHEPVRAELVLA
jgi:endonuclease/exonuclease/phosphatase family metal-dependent hydrolase